MTYQLPMVILNTGIPYVEFLRSYFILMMMYIYADVYDVHAPDKLFRPIQLVPIYKLTTYSTNFAVHSAWTTNMKMYTCSMNIHPHINTLFTQASLLSLVQISLDYSKRCRAHTSYGSESSWKLLAPDIKNLLKDLPNAKMHP